MTPGEQLEHLAEVCRRAGIRSWQAWVWHIQERRLLEGEESARFGVSLDWEKGGRGGFLSAGSLREMQELLAGALEGIRDLPEHTVEAAAWKPKGEAVSDRRFWEEPSEARRRMLEPLVARGYRESARHWVLGNHRGLRLEARETRFRLEEPFLESRLFDEFFTQLLGLLPWPEAGEEAPDWQLEELWLSAYAAAQILEAWRREGLPEEGYPVDLEIWEDPWLRGPWRARPWDDRGVQGFRRRVVYEGRRQLDPQGVWREEFSVPPLPEWSALVLVPGTREPNFPMARAVRFMPQEILLLVTEGEPSIIGKVRTATPLREFHQGIVEIGGGFAWCGDAGAGSLRWKRFR